jgi:hypothetical protein
MGLLSVLTWPVTGPVKGGWWVLQQIAHAAEEELYDEGKIVAELRALTADVEAGRISEEEHAAAEEVLLERLMEARAWRAQQNEEPW